MREYLIPALKKGLTECPGPHLIDLARWIRDKAEDVPDWVGILADANPEMWRSAIEVALADIAEEEKANG